jgi:subtilisin family serine protease
MPPWRLGVQTPVFTPDRRRSSIIPNQWVIKYKKTAGFKTASNKPLISAKLGAHTRLLGRIPQLNIETVRVSSPEIVKQIEKDPNVLWVRPRLRRYPLLGPPNDPAYNNLDYSLPLLDPELATWFKWDAHQIDSVPGWSIWPARYYSATNGKGADSVLIAVIDTGIDYDHPDFRNAGASSSNAALGGQLAVYLDRTIMNGVISPGAWDVYGHGTHVAGIAAAATNNGIGVTGVGYNATVMMIRTIDETGNGTDTDIAQAIVYAADHGALICNISLGDYTYSQAEQDAVNYAWRKGTLVVAAIGNDGVNDLPNYPGALNRVLAVGATAYNGLLTTYSNWGPPVSITAPGGDFDIDFLWFVGIYSTMPTYFVPLNDPNIWGAALDYDYLMGTSMSTPQVVGLAALYAGMKGYTQSTPNVPVLLWQAIQRGAMGDGGWDQYYGYGIINVYQTLNLDNDPNPRGDTVGGITGQVRYKGTPFANASVTARPVGGGLSFTTVTRADGNFRHANIPAGLYDVRATIFGSTTIIRNVQVLPGCDTPGLDINVGVTPTTVQVPNVTGTPGQDVTLRATLNNANTGAGIPDREITFKVDGIPVGYVNTDANGVATLLYTIPQDMPLGDVSLVAEFLGDETYGDNFGIGTLTVTTPVSKNTALELTPTVGTVGQSAQLIARLWSPEDGSNVVGRTVHFSIEGTPVGSAVTDSNGIATHNFIVPDTLGSGTKSVSATFDGDSEYNATSQTAQAFTIYKAKTYISFTNTSGTVGKSAQLKARLWRPSDGANIVGRTVSFTIGSTPVGSAVTGNDGMAVLNFVVPDTLGSGTQSVTASFAGDSAYNGFSRTATPFTIYKGNTYISFFNVSGKIGQTVLLRARLWRPSDGANIVGRTVSFFVEGTLVGSAVTGSDGVASLSYTIPSSLGTGSKNVTATFAGDSAYNGFTRTAAVLTVNP